MSIFNLYADYYDLVYQDKDYEGECDFLEQVFKKYSSRRVESVADWGCGTGNHSIILAHRGYGVLGIDGSRAMIRQARSKARRKKTSVDFILGCVGNTTLVHKVDAAIAMFAVVSYQPSMSKVNQMFRNVRKNLDRGGIFVFDCWHGPGVLSEKPTDRMKVLRRGEEKIIRFVHSTLDGEHQTVKVSLYVMHLKNRVLRHEVNENHVMRFFFPKELSRALASSGFRMLKLGPTYELNGTATQDSWNIFVIAQAI
jgi:SAM-dependent methyltransferase